MKRGFTLAELIGVLVVLALISMIAVPSVTNSLKKYKVQVCEVQLENILEAAKTWAADNLGQLPLNEGDTPKDVSLETLVKYGYIDDDLKDPKTKEKFETSIVVRIEKYKNKYTYKLYDIGDSSNLDDDRYIELSEYCER